MFENCTSVAYRVDAEVLSSKTHVVENMFLVTFSVNNNIFKMRDSCLSIGMLIDVKRKGVQHIHRCSGNVLMCKYVYKGLQGKVLMYKYVYKVFDGKVLKYTYMYIKRFKW